MPGFHDQHTARLLTKVATTGAAPLVVRSGHLGHTQVCERQLEVALVEHLCSYFLAARASEPVQLVFVPLPRFNAVEGRRRHGTTGRAVEQQAGTAKSLELLECGQDSRLVEIDASVDLIRADLDPGGSHTGTVIRPVVTVQDSDLPFLDVCAATECLRGTVTNRPNRLRARAHRLLGLPGAGSNTAARRPVDQQGQAGVPVAALERGHHGVADMSNAGVDGRGLWLESGSACVHDLPPLRGAASRRRRRPPHRPPTGKARQWAGECQPDGNSWLPPLLGLSPEPRSD